MPARSWNSGTGVAGAERHHPYAERPRRLADRLTEVGDPRLAGRVRRSGHGRAETRRPKRHLSLPHVAVRSSAGAPRGSAACTACTLSRSSRASSSAVERRNGVFRLIPALLTSRSTGAAVGEPLLHRGAAVVGGQIRRDRLHLAPCRPVSSAASAASRAASRATSTRSQPSAASRRANAAPMPAVAPVIRARRSVVVGSSVTGGPHLGGYGGAGGGRRAAGGGAGVKPGRCGRRRRAATGEPAVRRRQRQQRGYHKVTEHLGDGKPGVERDPPGRVRVAEQARAARRVTWSPAPSRSGAARSPTTTATPQQPPSRPSPQTTQVATRAPLRPASSPRARPASSGAASTATTADSTADAREQGHHVVDLLRARRGVAGGGAERGRPCRPAPPGRRRRTRARRPPSAPARPRPTGPRPGRRAGADRGTTRRIPPVGVGLQPTRRDRRRRCLSSRQLRSAAGSTRAGPSGGRVVRPVRRPVGGGG